MIDENIHPTYIPMSKKMLEQYEKLINPSQQEFGNGIGGFSRIYYNDIDISDRITPEKLATSGLMNFQHIYRTDWLGFSSKNPTILNRRHMCLRMGYWCWAI